MPISNCMKILIVNQLEAVWSFQKHQYNNISFSNFCACIYNYALLHCIEKVMVTRHEEFFVEDGYAHFQEFAFESHSYGSDNWADFQESITEEGGTCIAHPTKAERIVVIEAWMQKLQGHDVIVYGLDNHLVSLELCVALRHLGIKYTSIENI